MTGTKATSSLRLPRFFGGRLVRSLISLILFQTILFSIIQGIPEEMMPELEMAIGAREDLSVLELAPSEPMWDQYRTWMTSFYRGELGESTSLGNTPVMEILKEKLPRTLMLLLPGTIIGFLLGTWLGKLTAWWRRGWIENGVTLGGTAFYTSFPPWLAFLMINVFALSLGWFPPEKLVDYMTLFEYDISLNEMILKILLSLIVVGFVYLAVVWLTRNLAYKRSQRIRKIAGLGIIVVAIIMSMSLEIWPLAVNILYHLALPLITLILLSFGETMLIMKTTMSESVVAEYVTVARAKGLPNSRVRDHHAARVALLPVLTRFIVNFPLVIIGTFVIEAAFFWDGLGQELVRAANDNDLPVLMGMLSLVGVGILLAHIILDMVTASLDPRLGDADQARAAL